MFPPSAGERGLLPAVSLLLSEKVLGMRIIFFCLLFRQDTRKLTEKDLFFQAEGGITLIELILTFHFGFVFLGLEIHSALLCSCHVSALKQNHCTYRVLDP